MNTCQSVISIAGDMAVDNIQQHSQPKPVRRIYQGLHTTYRSSCWVLISKHQGHAIREMATVPHLQFFRVPRAG